MLLQLKEPILERPRRAQTSGLLVLDLEWAFGNGEHERNVIELRCGVRVYNYVQAFATVPQQLV